MKTVLFVILIAMSSIAFADDKYVNNTFGFEISAPASGATAGVYQHCAFYLPAQDGFAANVNVQMQQFAGSIEDYKKIFEEQFKEMSLKTIKSVVEAGTYVAEYAGKINNYELHFYAKAFKIKDRIYLVTASSMETRWKTQGPVLLQSVNSFKVK